MAGYVYAFASPSMAGIVKIGATTHDPAARLVDANSADTWRPPAPYELVCAAHVPSAFATERALHTILGTRRINARREFFRASYVEARSLFALLAEDCSQPAGEAVGDEDPARGPRASTGVAVGPAGQSHLRQEANLRSWVESNYTRVPLREKDTGTKLEALHTTYASAVPQVHAKLMGKTTFGKMIVAVYPGIGPHRGSSGETGLFLLR
jgi:hypothetical protein